MTLPNNNNWDEKFQALCYEVFYKNPDGKALLEHLENKYFRSPVAYPNKEPSWAYFNEGHRELIRSFTMAIQIFINKSTKPERTNNARRKHNI